MALTLPAVLSCFVVGHNPDVSKSPEPSFKTDPALAAALDLAREAALVESGGEFVGDHAGMAMEDERLATHMFACTSPAYVGWHWAVTVARAPRSKTITVSDVVLMPGDGALIAPPWVPWSERLLPGDLGIGDVLPTAENDPRLVAPLDLTAGLTAEDDLESVASQSPLSPGVWEIGLGRVRVLSVLGRDEAADRWQEGDFGPEAPMAIAAPESCGTCGFLLTIGGPMGQAFGVCANVLAPADGRMVSLAFGCGAHSEAVPVED
jgi:hypothetical protein